MSLAIKGTPPATRSGATAQELLPETAGGALGRPGSARPARANAAGPGISGTGNRFAHERSIPVRSRRVEERREFSGQRCLERRGPRLVGSGRVVQDEIHRHHGQQGVADAPGGGFLPEEQVFERRRRQPGEPGSHPVPVRLEGAARLGRKCFHRPLGAGPHPVKTRLPIQRDRRRPGQGRQFPGGLAALQVHLEEALLGMEIPEHPGNRRGSFPP